MKRIFDFCMAFLCLIILLPLFLLVGILIKIEDPNPIFFKQNRVGKRGKLFSIYKFRSMRPLVTLGDGSFEPGDTSRVTKIGKILRKTKIDELPQLLNVIKGDMSFVGPRPEVEKWIDIYPERWEKVLSVRPGITDNSSILFRDEESILSQSEDPEKTYREVILPKKLDLYEQYVDSHSFSGDIKMIFRTFFSIILK